MAPPSPSSTVTNARAVVVSIHPAGRVAAAAVPLMLLVGIGVGVATLGMMDSTMSHAAGCVDPLVCDTVAAGDFLARWTPAKQLPEEIQWAGFRSLTAVGLALTLLVLGVAALNLCTLVVAGSTPLRAEFALRAALGATPLSLVRLVGGRAILVSTGALVAGTVVGLGGAFALRSSWPLGAAPWEVVTASGRGPAAAASLLIAVFIASLLWPIGVAWSRELRRHLSTGARATTGPVEAIVRDALAVVQVAASLVVLVSAGLLVAAFSLSSRPAQVAADGGVRSLVAVVRLPEEPGSPSTAGERARQFEEILDRVRVLPGVVDSSVATEGSWVGLGVTDRVMALCLECWIGNAPKQQTRGPARIHSVSAGFLEGIGAGPRHGRSIEPGDDARAPSVAVISNAFAVEFFPHGEPLGKEVRLGGADGEWVRVVGIVDDLRVEGLGSAGVAEPAIYLSILQHPPSEAGLVVRTADDPTDAAAAITDAVARAAPGVQLAPPVPLEQLLDRHRAPLRWFGMLFGVLAALVMVVATGGLYGLIAYNVRRRTREIGVRMALGAEERGVLRMVMGHTMRLVALGVIVGLIPLSGLARLLQLRFQGVEPWDPALGATVVLLLTSAALAASYHPARRAARVDPQLALREG